MAKTTSYIQTLDGRTKVEWWDKEDFQGRKTEIYTAKDVTVIPIPDDTIICDFCNTGIVEFPVPVVWGTHALCPGCYKRIQKGGEPNEC